MVGRGMGACYQAHSGPRRDFHLILVLILISGYKYYFHWLFYVQNSLGMPGGLIYILIAMILNSTSHP